MKKRNIRAMKLSEVPLMINYFLEADDNFYAQLGVDPAKVPSFDQWYGSLEQDFERPIPDKQFFYVIWELNDVLVGHSHINNIVYGQEAFMHLHIWQPFQRKMGHGTFFVQESVKHYFQLFKLEKLFCQPYALNPAPNRTLSKVGFKFLKTYKTTPGWLNSHQPVNLWLLERTEIT